MKFRFGLVVVVLMALSTVLAQTRSAATSAGLEDYTRKLQLTSGLVITTLLYDAHNTAGQALGDYENVATITDVSAQGFSSSWNMTDPSHAQGHSFYPTVRQTDKVSMYAYAEGPPSGYSNGLRLSDSIYSNLKAGRTGNFIFDGPTSPGSIVKVGEEDLTVLVNERKARIHVLKGKSPQGWYFWIVDNPDFPMLIKMDCPIAHSITVSFRYPGEGEKTVIRELQEKGQATTHAVLFAFNSAELENESKTILNAVSGYLKQDPKVKLEIQGHTDNIGGAQFNLQLSRGRAESVKTYLAQQGIDPARLVAVGFGLTKPAATNTTAEGRAQNRRVVFRVMN